MLISYQQPGRQFQNDRLGLPGATMLTRWGSGHFRGRDGTPATGADEALAGDPLADRRGDGGLGIALREAF